MLKKIITILTIIVIVASMYNCVFAKYIEKQNIHIAEVNVVKRKRYSLKVYYMDKEVNTVIGMKSKRMYEGAQYEVEILEFEGYTYLYANKPITGIIEGETTIYCYYQKNTTT